MFCSYVLKFGPFECWLMFEVNGASMFSMHQSCLIKCRVFDFNVADLIKGHANECP